MSDETQALCFIAGANSIFLGEKLLTGRSALVDARLGQGHVVLFGVRPFHRFETQGSFFLVLNAMLNWNDLDAGTTRGATPTDSSR